MLRKILLTLSASVLLGTAVIAPYAALAQFGPPLGPQPPLAGPPPGLGAGGPPPGLSAGGPPLVVLRPDLSLAFLPVAPRPRLRVTSPVVRIVSMVQPDCMVSIAAARPIFAASRVAPRPTAPAATSAIVTPAMAMTVATGTGSTRRLPLTPMAADPMPPPMTDATTCPHPGDTAPGAFWSVMETD